MKRYGDFNDKGLEMIKKKKALKTVSFSSLIGHHVLDAVDENSEHIKNEYGSGYEDCRVIRFRLDGVVYAAIEDPDDGYRSSLDRIVILEEPMTNVFTPIDVIVYIKTKTIDEKSGEEDGDVSILEIVDRKNHKTVLEVGTDNTDDYYPYFVGVFSPHNMSTNDGK